MKTRSVTILIVRLIGIMNLFLAAAGLFGLTVNLFAVLAGAFRDTVSMPFLFEAVGLMGIVNLLFAGGLGIGGIWLFRLRPRAFVLCNVVYCMEIVYLSALALVAAKGSAWLPAGLLTSVGAASGIGNPFMYLQLRTGYPIVALLFLMLARKHAQSDKMSQQVSA